jgi:hypothetical protein
METLLGLMIGIGLSAACGFRVFIPLLVVSIGSHSGHVHLAHGFGWLGTMPALIALAVATAVEVIGYLVPYVDHCLDVMALPLAAVAGTVLTAGMVSEVSPFLRWTLAAVAGGGVATLTHGSLAVARAAVTTTTGGLGNPLFSILEGMMAFVTATVALLAPLVAVGFCLFVLVSLSRIARRLMRRKASEKPIAAPCDW